MSIREKQENGRMKYNTLLNRADYITISVGAQTHLTYGLPYPLTYMFVIPEGTNFSAYRKYLLSDEWESVPNKTSADFYNGIEAARFDYHNKRAYISLAFSDLSDQIFLKITDNRGNPIPVSFLGTSEYYDNRKAVVTASADDWYDTSNDQFVDACKAFRKANMWLTTGIITGIEGSIVMAASYESVKLKKTHTTKTTWDSVQQQLNLGYVEAASHSRSHPIPPYGDTYSEVIGSKEDIINNLDLPSSFKYSQNEYVYTWIEPYGFIDEPIREYLALGKYLADRSTIPDGSFYGYWSVQGLFERLLVTIDLDFNNITTLNDKFYEVYNGGGIYHVWFHPWVDTIDWNDPHNKVYQHLDVLKNRMDVWYVSFGHLYLYHYMQQNAQNSIVGFQSNNRFEWFSKSAAQRVWPACLDFDKCAYLLGITPDGKVAIQKPNQQDNTVKMLAFTLGQGFNSAEGWFSSNLTQRVWTADIDGDGTLDIVGISDAGSVFVMKGYGNGTFQDMRITAGNGFAASQGWFSTEYNQRVWPADINGDGAADLVGVAFDGRIMVMMANGDGTFQDIKVTQGVGFQSDQGWFSKDSAPRVWPADINGDGYADLVGIAYDGAVMVMISNGDGTFQDMRITQGIGFQSIDGWFAKEYSPRVWPADINGDGSADLVGIAFDGAVMVMMANGDGTFQNMKITTGNGFKTDQGWFSTEYTPRIWPIDKDGNGRSSLVGVAYDGRIMAMKANGDGTFSDIEVINQEWLIQVF
ncbi:MAG: VCBS repeat-containing protein [Clostridia bacterium]|nr:VCBS repeat-containing protein [Clostridia bacterium]